MSWIQKEQTYFYNSGDALQAEVDPNSRGSRFRVHLNNPIKIPKTAQNVTIECVSANIWFTSPNITPDYKNTTLHIEVSGMPYALVVPTGLYNAFELESVFDTLLLNNGLDKSILTVKGVTSTQRVEFTLDATVKVFTDETTHPNNVCTTLGFSLGAILDGSVTTVNTADSVATLNKINSFLISSNLANKGIAINNRNDEILTEIQVDVLPGKLITYRPVKPFVISADHLKVSEMMDLEFRLTNEKGELIDTNSEAYSFALVIKYYEYLPPRALV